MGTIDERDIGTFGVWTFDFESQPAGAIRDCAQAIEAQGWKSVWIPELLGRDAFAHAGFLLANTVHLNVINGIAQIWSRDALWTHGASVLLADAYPHRHVLGLGYGGGRRGEAKPLAAMAAYLDELDSLDTPNPSPRIPVRRILAAYGPEMLRLARERSQGAHTYHVNTAHTAQARDILGPGRFLGVEHAVLFETDAEVARSIAREHLQPYLNQTFNVAKFRRLGYTDNEIGHGGSDRLVDDLVFWGDVDTIVAKLRRHIDAGADHVAIQVIGIPAGGSAVVHWQALAEALL